MINITSRGAFRGEPTAPAYGAAKAAVNAFGQSFAKALGSENIYVFTIAPGFVDTGMLDNVRRDGREELMKSQSPLNRFAQPEEIARIVVFLAGEGTSNMTGCIIDSNGASYLKAARSMHKMTAAPNRIPAIKSICPHKNLPMSEFVSCPLGVQYILQLL